MKTGQFFPWTETSRRRPIPEEYTHLRKWSDVEEKSIDITNITNLKNINLQLEQTSKLYASNIISRVIAQLIGAYGAGFVTLEATSDGKLKVEGAISAGTTIGLDAGSELIGKIEVAGTSRTVLQRVISFSAAAHNIVIPVVTGKKIKIVNIFFTVFAEVNLTFESHETAISGAMDFGGTNEPRGMVCPLDKFPMETVAGEAFKILASTAVQVSGYCNYYTE